MTRRMRRWMWATALLVACGSAALAAPPWVARRMNPTLLAPPYQASAIAERLHRSLLVADLHADALLWGRDLNERGSWGHVDVPRLIEGGVGLQAFTVVTKVPYGQNYERNADGIDQLTALAVLGRWPVATWFSRIERALYQARQLHEAEVASRGRLFIITTQADLDAYLDLRRTNTGVTAGWLGIEGSQALDGSLANLARLDAAGFRMLSPAHFLDTEFCGSAQGDAKRGLTPLGRDLIADMERRHMVVDLAHASPAAIDDILRVATQPVVVSHTGVKGTCDNSRNLDDDRLKRIAATGGVVGIGYWSTAVCGPDADAVARAIRYTVNLIGVDAVALGSDFDGAISAPFDTTGVVLVTDALIRAGFSPAEIRKIAGENVLRVVRQVLPAR